MRIWLTHVQRGTLQLSYIVSLELDLMKYSGTSHEILISSTQTSTASVAARLQQTIK